MIEKLKDELRHLDIGRAIDLLRKAGFGFQISTLGDNEYRTWLIYWPHRYAFPEYESVSILDTIKVAMQMAIVYLEKNR